MPLDVPLLRKTMEHITDHPEEHDQEKWLCGSFACFAGRAAVLAGATDLGDGRVRGILGDRIEDKHVSDYAQRLLGLTDGEAARLFSAYNDAWDLAGMVDHLVEKGHLAEWGVSYYRDGTTEWFVSTEVN